MIDKRLYRIGEWLNTQGYDIDLDDDLWMEEYLDMFKFRDFAEMLNEFKEDHEKFSCDCCGYELDNEL